MNNPELILIGGGGHCRSCIDVIEQEAKYRIRGILDSGLPVGDIVLGYPVLGDDERIAQLAGEGCIFLITIGQIKSAMPRLQLFDKLKAAKASLATVISPRAYVAKTAVIGEGSIIMHGAIVNAAAKIGVNTIINTLSLIEHDAQIGDHCHISTGSLVNGACRLGDNVLVGSGSIISNSINIATDAIIGAGTIVIKDISEAGVFYNKITPLKKSM